MSLERRMARRRAKKQSEQKKKGPEIVLENPVSKLFPSFIIGNALKLEAVLHDDLIRLAPDVAESLEPYWGLTACIASNFQDAPAREAWNRFRLAIEDHVPDKHVVVPESRKGKHLVLCGAGPSLAENAAAYITDDVDEVWACNSALTWLLDHGHRVTHGVTVDQTPQMVVEWERAPDVKYLVATTIHPHLTDHLLEHGRELIWFHNFVGIQRPPVDMTDETGPASLSYEDWLYVTLYPSTMRAGSGLNTLNRALDVAQVMGFETITVLGADCAMRCTVPPPEDAPFGSEPYMAWLREHTIMHADGGNALASQASPLTMHAVIDSGTPDDSVRPGMGRLWVTKIDMAISGLWLVRVAQRDPRVRLIGDTFPNAIKDKSEAYLSRLPTMTDPSGNPLDLALT